ncbi:hypothetical protein ACH5RR_028450 [Cinchona calisaya]|uniref:SHSP domain-containing protein n=1 Tax=Cinchona calisaya TaxID=153742 RepID=A0ABD2YSK2_9GENT
MENQAVRRRVNIIASHLSAHEDLSATATHLFPMSCSNSLNSVIQRCDSRMSFARQISSSQACFMRQVSNEQGQGSYGQSTVNSKYTGTANEGLHAYEAPMFSRPSTIKPSVHNIGELQPQQPCNYHQPLPDPLTFAQPSRSDPHSELKESKQASKFNVGFGLKRPDVHNTEFEWLPKMDVAESGCNYVITIELPGVSASNIRVEIKKQNLRVAGYRSIDWWKVANCSIDSISAYHRKEIAQGPYEIVWPLPDNVNKDNISAELVDGLLLISIPKVSEAYSS